MSHHKSPCKKFDQLKTRKACIKHLKVKTAEIKIADIDSAVITDAEITCLDVKNFSINGQDLTCQLTTPPVVQKVMEFVPFGSTGPTGPPANVNPNVYQCLIQNAILNQAALQQRVFEGRSFIADYLQAQGCPPSCPPGPTGPVPLDIYGTLTVPIYRRVPCGPTGATGATGSCGPCGPCGSTGATGAFLDKLNTAVNFNLQVDYLLEVANSIDARLTSVLVQMAYVDPLGPTGDCSSGGENIIIEEIFIANKQFYPTLDTLYGENFANTISIPTALLIAAYDNSPNPNNQGAIQMVVYKEEGICIWTPHSDGSFDCLQDEISNPSSGVQEQTVTPCPPDRRRYDGGYNR